MGDYIRGYGILPNFASLFKCFTTNKTLSNIITAIVNKDANFLPLRHTVTVNVNELALLNMTENKFQDLSSTVWKKDDKELPDIISKIVSRTSLIFDSTEVGYAGIYSLDYKSDTHKFDGYLRLIVRVCPEGKYGESCNYECPQCFNGGICHDITGTCICAPGFSGKECESACKPGSFGQECSLTCSLNSDKLDCQNILICLPDPYGCSCAAGFKGYFCNESCDPGTYGAGCNEKRNCHCAGDESCSIYTGVCENGCTEGWYGKYCNQSIANLNHISYSATPSFFVNLTWERSHNLSDNAEFYNITYKHLMWDIPCHLPIKEEVFEKSVNETSIVLEDLEPFSVYEVNISVVVVDLDGSQFSSPVSKINITTSNGVQTDVHLSILEERNSEVLINLSRDPKASGANFLPYKTGSIQRKYFILVDATNRISCNQMTEIWNQTGECSSNVAERYIYVAGQIDYLPPDGRHFTVGDNGCKGGYLNSPLKNDKPYTIIISSTLYFPQEKQYCLIDCIGEKVHTYSGSKSNAWVAVIVLSILVIAIMFGVIYIKRQRKFEFSTLRKRFINKKDENDFDACNEGLEDFDIVETESICEELSNCLLVKDLKEFVKQNVKNNKIRKEFSSLPRGQIYACSSAKLKDNKIRNRYGNILPYDHTRVIINNAGDLDYIHANYIDGYKKDKTYIATQGPMPHTVREFWYMVWQENSTKIVMVTNTIEGGKCKCEKYWTDDVNSYGDITVLFKCSESFADFEVRTFDISRDHQTREIKQFHFTSWPDHGVPLNTTPFINFLKRIQAYNSKCEAPIVAHCSAGIGRTGAVILFANMYQMGINEKQVDILGHLSSLRKQRMNIVDNYDQYLFVYHALVESLCVEETTVNHVTFLQEYNRMTNPDEQTGLSSVEMQFKILNDLPTQFTPRDILSAYLEENQAKNRSMHILPNDRVRPILKKNSNGSDYINAVYIDGYSHKNICIATQHPLPDTISDFWRMVYGSNSRIIVLVQDISDSKEPNIFSVEDTQVHDEFVIKCVSCVQEDDVITANLTITESTEKNPPLSVRVMQMKTWSSDCNLPPNTSSIMSAIRILQQWNKDSTDSILTISCLDGVTACGAFCTFLHIIDRIQVEQEVDIFQAVKCTRTNRAQFIVNLDQYRFLFDLTKAYLESTPQQL